MGTLAAFLTLGATATTSAGAEPDRPHELYLELLGKGGLWGLGYERRLTDRAAAGAVASFYLLDGDRVVVFSPYLGAELVTWGRHSWFAHAGAQLVHAWTPSPVPEWSGRSATGVGGELSTGYQYRARLTFRAYAQGVAGKGGIVPWLGASVGWAF